ncbi:MAG: transposase [Campylobacterota bacterium]
MPRRPRIDMVGSYHIVNRGVEQRVVYKDNEDFEMFLTILCTACQLYGVQLHGYVLMRNHYHLLIETKDENLSRFMKHLNASYAIYFNKKYKRSGHLWQGRFKSWYVTDEAYLYTLIGYIENNPVKAKIVKELGDYPYSSYRAFSEETMTLPCLKESFVFKEFPDVKERIEFLQYANDERLLEEIKKASNLVVTSIKKKELDPNKLNKMLLDTQNNIQRNKKIYQAYLLGYSQHTIAQCLGVSQPHINRIVKKERGIGDNA